jgi:hypothetical protein
VEVNRGKTLALVEQKQSKDHIELTEIDMLMSVIGSLLFGP